MRIHNNNGKVEIYTPYNKEFVQKSKESEKQDGMENAGSSTRKTSMLQEKL